MVSKCKAVVCCILHALIIHTSNHCYVCTSYKCSFSVIFFTKTVEADEIRRLSRSFKRLDLNQNGSLSADEFLSIPELQQNPLVRRVIDILDTDRNGEVDFQGVYWCIVYLSTTLWKYNGLCSSMRNCQCAHSWLFSVAESLILWQSVGFLITWQSGSCSPFLVLPVQLHTKSDKLVVGRLQNRECTCTQLSQFQVWFRENY